MLGVRLALLLERLNGVRVHVHLRRDRTEMLSVPIFDVAQMTKELTDRDLLPIVKIDLQVRIDVTEDVPPRRGLSSFDGDVLVEIDVRVLRGIVAMRAGLLRAGDGGNR